MPEKTSAENLLERIDQKTENVEEDSAEEQEPVDEDEEVETTDSESEEGSEEEQEELPENIKEILRKNRKELRTIKAELADTKKQLETKETPEGEETAKAEDSRYKNLFINTAAKAALVEAGFTTGTDRFAKMIDTSTLTVEDDGTITGLDEQVEEIKEDFADVIAKPAKKPQVKADAARRTDTPSKPKSSADTLAAMMTGGNK